MRPTTHLHGGIKQTVLSADQSVQVLAFRERIILRGRQLLLLLHVSQHHLETSGETRDLFI